MASSERMTCLVDRDICKSSVRHAWTSVLVGSVLRHAVSGFLSALHEL